MSPPYFYSNMKTLDILKNNYQNIPKTIYKGLDYLSRTTDSEIIKNENQKRGVEVYSEKEV